MAYIDSELRNVRIVWDTIADRLFIIALIAAGMAVAGVLSAYLGYVPHEIVPPR
ncbi:hypothetical protein [Roseinatronobacter alkalisoli]|uniref:Uncharacterized protein n=1 Tax=Roseinatronobacter alkalisoli TaxID=3028235 RepID=A0ABT5T4Q7_9RHOB|nr:hypothetical protein [Roseinatronobacter sp. HJB301]MDD7970102.1 hypothetical protein [Roseinatronobacter sp. HJB301]